MAGDERQKPEQGASEPEQQYDSDPNLLSQFAASYLQRQNADDKAATRPFRSADIHALRRVERKAIKWAAIAGIISGGIVGGLEVFVFQDLVEDLDWREQIPYWLVFFAIAGVISGVEILFMYWKTLKAIGYVSVIANISLQENHHGIMSLRGLARTTLEFPNPRSPVYGIDPYALMPRWKFATQNVLYRMKVGVSSFILRVLLRRMLARAALRGLIPLLTGPLYAFWNGFITWRIMRQAREQALGPLVIESLMEELVGQREQLGDEARQTIIQGVAELMRRSQNAHPNYVSLIARLMEELGDSRATIELDWSQRCRRLKSLNDQERRIVISALTVASVIGGKVGKQKQALVKQAHEASGLIDELSVLTDLRAAFLAGESVTDSEMKNPVIQFAS